MDHVRNLFVLCAAVLLGFGVLMVHSASVTSRPTEFEQVYLLRHLVFLAFSLSAALIASCIPGRWWLKLAPWLFLGTLALLIVVLIPGIGVRVKGAQRWFRLAGFSLQPSELMKIALPLMICRMAHLRQDRLHHWFRGLPPVLPAVVALPLVLAEPDLGTTVFLALSAGLALWANGWPLRNFVMGASLAIPPVVWLVTQRPYQVQRVLGFLATWNDWTTAPYQLKQGLVTLASGGWRGVGLGRGVQKLSFLPEANTDFVFAVIGEELGLTGVLTVVSLWLALYVLGYLLIKRLSRLSFEYGLALTLMTQLLVQVALNVAVVTAMVPPKGISHPLISYGGSNLLVSLTLLGMFLGLTQGDHSTATASNLTKAGFDAEPVAEELPTVLAKSLHA